MAINLKKGEKIELRKETPGLKDIIIGLGWDTNKYDGGNDFDLDAGLVLRGEDGKIISDKHFVFYSNLKSPDGAVEHTGDNLTGEGDGDDEKLIVKLDTVDATVKTIEVIVDIYDASSRMQNFGMVNNAFARVINKENDVELVKYDLGEDFSIETAVKVCELKRTDSDWEFVAIGEKHTGFSAIADELQ